MNTKHNGFTIVELLVVIVVIAVLASITLVSYNGIRNRAYNVATIQAATTARDLITAAYSAQGTMNITSGIPKNPDGDTGVGFCIGSPSDFPADGHFGNGECNDNAGYRGYWASAELWGILSQYGSGNMNTGVRSFSGDFNVRGITWTYQPSISDDRNYDYIHYHLYGPNLDCAIPGSEDVSDIGNGFEAGPDETSCWLNMNKLLGSDDIIVW